MQNIAFQAKKNHPEEKGDEASMVNKKIFKAGLVLIGLGILLFVSNNYIFHNEKFGEIAITIGIIGAIQIMISRIQYQTDNDILSGNLRGTIVFENSRLLIDDMSYDYNTIQNFKFITLNYRDENFEISGNYNDPDGTKGFYNWISFSYENKNYKFYFLLENKKHQQEFLNTMELLKSKMPIKKAYDF